MNEQMNLSTFKSRWSWRNNFSKIYCKQLKKTSFVKLSNQQTFHTLLFSVATVALILFAESSTIFSLVNPKNMARGWCSEGFFGNKKIFQIFKAYKQFWRETFKAIQYLCISVRLWFTPLPLIEFSFTANSHKLRI